MSIWNRRTILAVVAIAAAVLIPCTAWFIVGSKAVSEEQDRLVQAAQADAQTLAVRLAERTGARLETLIATESRRPYEHYETDSELRRASCPCSMMDDSPLAQGLSDPLVASHFQVNSVGQWSLPALAGQDPTVKKGKQKVLDALECSGSPAEPAILPEPAGLPSDAEAKQAVVGPFQWEPLTLDGAPVLAALREVTTPGSRLRQGFLVDSKKLNDTLADAAFPATIQPSSESPIRATIPLEGVDWEVALDASTIGHEALAQVGALRSQFLKTFFLGLALALAAGGLTIGLLLQSERIANQRSQFAAAAAHELRTPLAGMKLYGEMLAEGVGSEDKRTGYGQRIADEAGRLGRVVNNVLGYTQLERGTVEAGGEVGDLNAAVHQAIESIRPSLEAKGVTLQVHADSDLPPVRFQPDALMQMLQNLIDNAEKYSRESKDRTVDICLRQRASGVELSIEDRGPGVPPSIRRKLFSPFTRGETADAPSGLGLGLAMVKALAKAQKAEVSYRDREQGGAAFSIRFPTLSG